MSTYWNGQLTPCRKVYVEVGPTPASMPRHWARDFRGQVRSAVEVVYCGRRFFIDDEYGQGWRKVTCGRGLSSHGHRDLPVSEVLELAAGGERFAFDLEEVCV